MNQELYDMVPTLISAIKHVKILVARMIKGSDPVIAWNHKKRIDDMGMIDQMKYAKILYLADVLEDIQNEMNRDYHCHNYVESISDIVKSLRETIAVTDAQGEMKCEDFEIRRMECRSNIRVLDVPIGEIDDMEKHIRRDVEDSLLREIAKKKLIDVRMHKDRDNNMLIFTASLIVGISKQPYVPQEPMPTFVDNLTKYLDETRQ